MMKYGRKSRTELITCFRLKAEREEWRWKRMIEVTLFDFGTVMVGVLRKMIAFLYF